MNPQRGKKEESAHGEGQSSRYASSNSAFLTFYLICHYPPPSSFPPSLSNDRKTPSSVWYWLLRFLAFFPFFPVGRLNPFSWIIIVQLPARQARPRKPAKETDHIKPIQILQNFTTTCRQGCRQKTRKREGCSDRLAQSGCELASWFQF